MLFRSNTSFQNIGWQLYLVSKKKGGGGIISTSKVYVSYEKIGNIILVQICLAVTEKQGVKKNIQIMLIQTKGIMTRCR
ncbi:Os09g0388850 [Oryza sativa Japonica Group]|uniref:Os09g0388850 protein n=1 Tax=Oryza sativa subsp. japonica TaxID=39947 RepID=A0A0P0XMK2_ORYSJ|nr:Os09g0388850 [Oryza sativa Japonica Group]